MKKLEDRIRKLEEKIISPERIDSITVSFGDKGRVLVSRQLEDGVWTGFEEVKG